MFIWRGTESIRLLEVIAAPLMIAASIALVVALMLAVPGAQLFGLPAKDVPGGPNTWAALTGLVGFWATLALNIPDFTRFARTQRDQVLGQAIGLGQANGVGRPNAWARLLGHLLVSTTCQCLHFSVFLSGFHMCLKPD